MDRSTASSDHIEVLGSPNALTDVGIVELLEQDGRPTFIVDLAVITNASPGTLRIAYANPALRSNAVWSDLVTGKALDPGAPDSARTNPPQSSGPEQYRQFKNWLLSAAPQGQSLDVCLPSFLYGGIVWGCSTVRRRFRVISASSILHDPSSQAQSSASTSLPPPPRSSTSAPHQWQGDAALAQKSDEPDDYFGNAVSSLDVVSPRDASTRNAAEHDPSSGASTAPPSSSHGLQHSVNGESTNAETSRSPLETRFVHDTTGPSDLVSSLHLPQSNMHLESIPSVLESTDALEAQGFFDWTRLPISHTLPHHIQFARSIQWDRTALGPIDQWSADLRQMCNLIMASPHPAAMYWGEDLVAIYNEAYVSLAGQKHPKLMGQSYRDAWAEIWDEVKDVFASARQTGEATMKDDDCLFIKRSDYLEEVYFSWSIIPMVGGDGTVTGLYNPAFEKTRRKIAERRMLTLREVGERTATARDVKGFWNQVSAALESNEYDTPFVLLYSVADESDSDSSSIHSNSLIGTKQCYLEGALGVPSDHPVAPTQSELKDGQDGFVPIFREVMKLDKPVLLDIVFPDGHVQNTDSAVHSSADGGGVPHSGTAQIPFDMLDGIQWRGFGDPCRSVVVCPVHPTTGESILGFLVLGINPRRPYDDDYHLFVQLLSRQLATSLASVVLFEEEIRRGQKAAKLAALDRIELSQQLAARTQEARDIETRFTRMAEFSPAGLFIADSEGHITYCNDTWYEITRVPKDSAATDQWIDAVKEEDQQLVRATWQELVQSVRPVTVEFRFKAPWEDRNGNKGDTWVLFSAYPEKFTEDVVDPEEGGKLVSSEGSLKGVFGSVTNISQQKWTEGFQKHKMEEAVELKRQQENFIDITR